MASAFAILSAVLLAVALAYVAARRWGNHLAASSALRFRARIDRYKLARRRFVRAHLLANPAIAQAVKEHATTAGTTEEAAWRTVRGYIQEIVPFFNIIAYYQ